MHQVATKDSARRGGTIHHTLHNVVRERSLERNVRPEMPSKGTSPMHPVVTKDSARRGVAIHHGLRKVKCSMRRSRL